MLLHRSSGLLPLVILFSILHLAAMVWVRHAWVACEAAVCSPKTNDLMVEKTEEPSKRSLSMHSIFLRQPTSTLLPVKRGIKSHLRSNYPFLLPSFVSSATLHSMSSPGKPGPTELLKAAHNPGTRQREYKQKKRRMTAKKGEKTYGELDPNPAIHEVRYKRTGRFTGTLSDAKSSSAIGKARAATFGHLGLQELKVKKEMGSTRVRNHVNPLSVKYSIPLRTPDWTALFDDPCKDLFIDIGCAAGRFSLAAAQDEAWGNHNHLGLEIRDLLVVRANIWLAKLLENDVMTLKNCAFLHCNANVNLETVLKTYPGTVSHIAIQFPDPHFKKKHRKRRVVNSTFVRMLGRRLKPGTKLFFQSDVEAVAAQMRDRLTLSQYFQRVGSYTERNEHLSVLGCATDSGAFWTQDGKCIAKNQSDYGDWLIDENPIGIKTERESQNKALNLPVYKCLFERKDVQYAVSQKDIMDPVCSAVQSLNVIAQSSLARLVALIGKFKSLRTFKSSNMADTSSIDLLAIEKLDKGLDALKAKISVVIGSTKHVLNEVMKQAAELSKATSDPVSSSSEDLKATAAVGQSLVEKLTKDTIIESTIQSMEANIVALESDETVQHLLSSNSYQESKLIQNLKSDFKVLKDSTEDFRSAMTYVENVRQEMEEYL